MKRRVNNRPETKRTVYLGTQKLVPNLTGLDAGLAAGGVQVGLLWSNNGVDTIGGNWFPQPTQGVGQNQVIGTKYNIRYCELTMLLQPTGAAPTNLVDCLRIILIRERQPNTTIANAFGVGNILKFANFLAPVDTKNWDVQFDKIYTYTTGLSTVTNPGTNNIQTMMPRPKIFRFIIPLKDTLEIQQIGVNNEPFTHRMYLYCFTNTDVSYWVSPGISAIYYYRDP